jgi:pimeloyl-ACP methyl ester carboxylesterase
LSDAAITPAAPTLADAQRVTFAVGDGLTLVGDAWGPRDAAPVLLLHGGGQTRHAWAGTAVALARRGWRALALDQRGHGDSSWDPAGDYSRNTSADDVVDVVRALARPPVLVGASLGGIASLLATHRGEGDVAAALVLVDIATRMEPVGVERIFAFMQGHPDGFASLEEAADAIAAYNPHRPRPKDLSGLRKNLRLGDDGRWRWHWDPAFMASRDPAEPPREHRDADLAAEALRIPTLLVRGRMSDMLSEEGVRVFLGQVPHAKYADITDAGHMVAGDRNDVFCDAVLDFLAAEVPAP